MNIDLNKNELTIYEGTTVDEGEVATIFKSNTGYTITLTENYNLKEVDDGYGGKAYSIQRNNKIRKA